MADLTITAASVVPADNASKTSGTAGEAITAGQAVYRDTTTHKFMKADANSATAAARTPIGIALNGASLNQPVDVQTDGDLTIGATLTPGTVYYLSGTPGGIAPVGDMVTGIYPCVIGIAKSASLLALDIKSAGVAL